MSSKRVRKQSKFISHMNGPIRVLARSWDSYVKSLAVFAGPVAYANAMSCPTSHIPTVYSNYGTTDEELRNLTRLATDRRLTAKFEAPGFHRPKSVVPICGGGASAPRGNTAAFRKIDEDREC
ncbi:hypothetical protein PHJA_002137300 [Phtheirospermum japonicum]|uniref:Uncharacterized protein n=1 Tax=Phtheirospermum japonicum TaxID=374723 RepID=A0A830CNX4_9LAMI|nr:hypothetical protein PHJA_002137300 [Phtheirospermum japonicum]